MTFRFLFVTISLVKMVARYVENSGEEPTWYELQHAIMRNFDGLNNIQPIEVFEKHLQNINQTEQVCCTSFIIVIFV